MARPKAEIDKKQFEQLCGLQCTRDEICDWFNVTDKTLSNWCKRTYGEGFSATYNKKRGTGKISLRRMQFKLAEKSATMAIWLGKQYLGQRDQVSVDIGQKVEDDALSASLRQIAEGLDSDEAE